MPVSNLTAALLHHAARAGEEPWLFRSEGWDWRWHSWGELARQATAWAGALSGLPPGSRAAFSYAPRPPAIVLDLAIQGAGLISVPVSGERGLVEGGVWVEAEGDGVRFAAASELPHPRPSSPRPSSPVPSRPPSPGEEGEKQERDVRDSRDEQQDRPSQIPLSRGGGWGGRERGRGAGLGGSGGALVRIGDSPVEVKEEGLVGMAEGVQRRIAPARRAGEREIVVLGGPLESPEERAMLSWAALTGAAVALEPEPGLRIATAAWVRPTVFHGTIEEVAALRAWVEKGRKRGLPFGRLRTLLLVGGEMGDEDARFWQGRGVKVERLASGLNPEVDREEGAWISK